jgi:hypothetical protein
MPGIALVRYRSELGSNKVIKAVTRDPGGSDLGQLPYCLYEALRRAGGRAD